MENGGVLFVLCRYSFRHSVDVLDTNVTLNRYDRLVGGGGQLLMKPQRRIRSTPNIPIYSLMDG